MHSILVSGGAGYIGSHTVKTLLEQGYKPVVLDNLVTGHRQSVSCDVPFFQGDIADSRLVREIVEQERVSAVIHFAARSLVGESAEKPDLYFEENTAKTNRFVASLIETARQVTGQMIPVLESPRRPGDPDKLVAKVEKIQALLRWSPNFSSIEQIMESAWAWHLRHPFGFQ